MLRTQSDVADLTNSAATGRIIPFMPGYFSPGSIYRTLLGMRLTHTLSTNALYELRLQYMTNKHHVFQTKSRDITPKYEIIPGYKVNEAPFGYWGFDDTGLAGTHLGGWMNLGRDASINSTIYFAGDFTTQYNAHNQVKTGFEFYYNDFTFSVSLGITSKASPTIP